MTRMPTVDSPKIRSLEPFFWSACFVAFVGFVLFFAERGAETTAAFNPDGVGMPRPVEPLFPGFDVVFWGQIIAVPLAIGLIAWFIREWRRQPGSPAALMLLASSSVCWLDPLNNWAIHLVYNPGLWHFPKGRDDTGLTEAEKLAKRRHRSKADADRARVRAHSHPRGNGYLVADCTVARYY